MVNPKANVTIVHGANLPISDAFPDYFRQKAVTTLKEHGIDIILNEFVDLTTINNASKSVTLKSGKTLAADLVVLSTSIFINSSSWPQELLQEEKSSKPFPQVYSIPKHIQSKSKIHSSSMTLHIPIFLQLAT
jgi:NADH dehydrogenase FAD-containing subunit